MEGRRFETYDELLYSGYYIGTVAKIASTGLSILIILSILCAINPNVIAPFSLFEFWTNSAENWFTWFKIGKPLFIWQCGLIVFLMIITKGGSINRISLGSVFILSLLPGIVEEIVFRWLVFLQGVVLFKLINFFFFGWLGLGIAEGIHNLIFGPIVNALTLGYLSYYLVNPQIWFIGASIISTNAMFRDGHAYQGVIGWINSWFMGMFLFWVMLNYGLVNAILIHVFNNFIHMMINFILSNLMKKSYW